MRVVIEVSAAADGNLALHTARGAAEIGSARVARRRWLARFGLDADRLVVGEQVHGARVREVTAADAGRGATDAVDAFPATDGLMTRERGIPLMVLGADCPLVCLHDPEAPGIAVLHAGWRGILAGVLEAGLNALAPRAPGCFRAWLGPSAGECCYEVGEELAAQFPPEAVVRVSGCAKPRLALRRAVETRLGMPVSVLGPQCTICDDRWFSYRRNGTRWRHALVAALV